MQTRKHVELVEATAAELFQVLGHACFVGLTTQQRTIGISHKLIAVKPEQVVNVITVPAVQMAVCGRRWWVRRMPRRRTYCI